MMTNSFTCDDKATLVAYLYGEVDAAVRNHVERHLAGCATCAAEVAALGDVRAELGLWVPPDAELGFMIVKKPERAESVLQPARGVEWWRGVPAWAQAAAAVLVVGAGLGIANVQVRSGPDGLSVSTGWMNTERPAVSQPFDGAAVERRVGQALISLEQQLRTEIRSARDQQQPSAVRTAAPSTDDATLRRVQQLITASEERQRRELALRLTQLNADMNLQRRADLMRITQSLGQFDEQILRQRQMINNAIRISASGQQ